MKKKAKSKPKVPVVRAIAKIPSLPERIETLLMQGDLTGLSVSERLQFYKTLCRTLGLNPLTRPFEYIIFTDREQDEESSGTTPKGKMQLYARADCAAQLRKIHKVGTKIISRERVGDFYHVVAETFIGPRTDSSIGIVWLKRWKKKDGQLNIVDLTGRELANAMMKAETKAKRRATFSICGLHVLDESDLEDLTSLTFEVSESGRVVEIAQPAQQALPSSDEHMSNIHSLAVLMAQRQRDDSEDSFKARVARIALEFKYHTSAQIQSLLRRFEERMERKDPQPVCQAEAPQPSGTAAQAGARPTTGGPAPAEYPGFTFRQLADGNFGIEAPKALIRQYWSSLKAYQHPELNDALICDATACGRMMSELEKIKVRCRMVGDNG